MFSGRYSSLSARDPVFGVAGPDTMVTGLRSSEDQCLSGKYPQRACHTEVLSHHYSMFLRPGIALFGASKSGRPGPEELAS